MAKYTIIFEIDMTPERLVAVAKLVNNLNQEALAVNEDATLLSAEQLLASVAQSALEDEITSLVDEQARGDDYILYAPEEEW